MPRPALPPSMAATMESVQVRTRIDPRTCEHRELAYLGAGGSVSYYRCRVCGTAVIQERSRRWVIRGIGEETR